MALMDGEAWVALGALVLSVVTLVWSRLDVRRARADADRAGAEAAEARELLRRATEAQEQQAVTAARDLELTHGPVMALRVVYQSTPGSYEYRIRNDGQTKVHAVTMLPPDAYPVTPPGPVDLSPGEYTDPLRVRVSPGTRPLAAVTVTCSEWDEPRSLRA